MDIRSKRVYFQPTPDDGCRVLVDRLWPRGLSKEKVNAELWLKEVAPSHELRKWFGHERPKWESFKHQYFSELDERADVIERLIDLAGKVRLTLLYATKDTEYNHAVALKEYLLTHAHRRTE